MEVVDVAVCEPRMPFGACEELLSGAEEAAFDLDISEDVTAVAKSMRWGSRCGGEVDAVAKSILESWAGAK